MVVLGLRRWAGRDPRAGMPWPLLLGQQGQGDPRAGTLWQGHPSASSRAARFLCLCLEASRIPLSLWARAQSRAEKGNLNSSWGQLWKSMGREPAEHRAGVVAAGRPWLQTHTPAWASSLAPAQGSPLPPQAEAAPRLQLGLTTCSQTATGRVGQVVVERALGPAVTPILENLLDLLPDSWTHQRPLLLPSCIAAHDEIHIGLLAQDLGL